MSLQRAQFLSNRIDPSRKNVAGFVSFQEAAWDGHQDVLVLQKRTLS
jgi:hypothetical protein